MSQVTLVKILTLSLMTWVSPAFAADKILRDSDLLHFDVREVVNFANTPANVSVSTQLCGAFKQGSEVSSRIFCLKLDDSPLIQMVGKSAGEKMSIQKFSQGNQSQRRQGSKVNELAKSLASTIQGSMNNGRTVGVRDVQYRVALTFNEIVNGASQVIETQYSAFPDLSMEAPAEARGLLIDTHEMFNSARTLKTRTLIVITRRGESK